MKAKSTKHVLKEIGCDKLELHSGKDYWYFIYTDKVAKIYEDRSVMVPRLNTLTLEQWVEEGKDFLDEVLKKD